MKPRVYRALEDEDERREPGTNRWLRIGAVVLMSALALAVLTWAFQGLGSASGPPARQVARIAILPDTPPPPPPPPPERKPEAPKDEARSVPTPQPQARPETPPADAPLKMEGPAGTGPSAFSAGSVTSDYSGGTPKVGGVAASATTADRAGERLYANSVKQALQREIDRHLDASAGEIAANFAIWIGADGRIDRWLLDPGNEAAQDAALRTALERSALALRLPPPPPAAAQPLRYRLTVRAAG